MLVGLFSEPRRDRDVIGADFLPPDAFIAGPVGGAVMDAAEWRLKKRSESRSTK